MNAVRYRLPLIPVTRPERDWEWYESVASLVKDMRRRMFDGEIGLIADALNMRRSQYIRLEAGELRLTDRQADMLGGELARLTDAAAGKGN
jgi:hypothetical protein